MILLHPRESEPLWLRVAIRSLAGLQLTIAVAALIAWVFGGVAGTQIDPDHAPFHFNGAIALLLWSLSLLALMQGWRTIARCLAGVLLVFAGICLLHNLHIIDWGISHWLFDVNRDGASFPPSGLGSPAIVTFVIGSFALLVMATVQGFTGRSLFLVLCGVFLIGGGIAVLVGGRTPMPEMQTFGAPLLGVAGCVLGGIAIFLHSLRGGLERIRVGHSLPVLVGITGIAFTLILWQGLNGQQAQRIQRTVQFEANHMHRLVEANLPQRLTALNEMAERLRPGPEDTARISSDAAQYVARQPGCLGIARIDDNRLHWIEPANTARLPKTLNDMGVKESLDQARQEGTSIVVRAPRSRWNGTRVVIIYSPIHPNTNDRSGLVSVIRLQELFDSILNANVSPGYALEVVDQDESVFGRHAADTRFKDSMKQSLPIRFQQASWTLQVWPTQDAMARESLSLPRLALAVGLFTAILLAMAVHLAQTARLRTRELEREMRERLQAEGAVKESEAKYRTLIENLEQAVFLKDRNGRYLAANRVFCQSIGQWESAVIGREDADFFPDGVAKKHAEEDRLVLAEGKRIEAEEDRQIDGVKRTIRRIITPVRDASGNAVGVLGICWDVTEQRLIEGRLRQAGKMDAIGQLAGGIAHDFNNLLTAILGNLDLMLATLSPTERNHELALAVQNAAVRAAGLTRRLLGFSRQHQLDWEPTDVNGIVDEVVTLLRRTIDPRIRIETRKSPEKWNVLADASQLNQVIMNLCLNARDAIAGPGKIQIETDCVEVTEMQALGSADARVGSFVRLRVGDTGSGMSPEVRARIFEPFFTTKEVGKGTGLGLAMVFAIIKAHHGWIECDSELGHGTRFDIYLPRSAVAVRNSTTPLPPSEPESHGPATILVVDDESMIRRLAAVVLQNDGFDVIEAEDGQQAVEIFEREHERIDLVLLDLTMPNLSGQEALRQMWQIDPNVKALFASGYAAEQITSEEHDRILGFVKKPYRPSELLQTIHEALQGIRHSPSHAGLELAGCDA